MRIFRHRFWQPASLTVHIAMVCLALFVASCATPPGLPAKINLDEALNIDDAINALGDSLAKQFEKAAPPIGAARPMRNFVIDRVTDARSGQTTAITQEMRQRITASLGSKIPGANTTPLDRDGLGKADFVVAGSLSNEPYKAGERRFRLQVSIANLKTGLIAAQSSVWLKGEFDTTPDLFYRDSPIVPRDPVVAAQTATARAAPGSKADARYLDQLPTGAILNEAEIAYNRGNSEDAARLYDIAAARPDGKTLRTYSGLYLTNTRLDRKRDSEAAFSGLLREGIANNELSIRFLFKVGSTEFVEDPLHGPQYPMWLRQLAQNFWKARDCVEIAGHSSRTGSEDLNDKLSAYRAEAVLRYMMLTEPRLQSKIKAVGKGFRETIVGSGADNASDAVDRRVEFRVVPCS